MSNNKLKKYLKRKLPVTEGEKQLTPCILTDSKGRYLRELCNSDIEREIVWWDYSGRTTSKGYSWLVDNLDRQITRLGNVHVYIWLGTCDLTTYDHSFISPSSESDTTIKSICDIYRQIIQLIRDRPNCRLTFLEIPVYSIVEWNKYKRHDKPNSFKKQDDLLIGQVIALNEKIRGLNSELSSRAASPIFSTDISHIQTNSRSHKTTIRDNYNFSLYKDGIHPTEVLAKVWLKKITQVVQSDCWE